MNVRVFLKKYSEPAIWSLALLGMFLMDPANNNLSFCVLKALGVSWCPGCGLGHSIHYALHMDFKNAWNEHPLGIPATAVILYQLYKTLPVNYKNNYHEPGTITKGYT